MYLLSTNLPVVDETIPIDDVGVAIGVLDGSSAFKKVLSFLISRFYDLFTLMDSIIIYDDTSLLDFHIAVSVFAILLSVLIVTVKASTSNSISSVDSSRRAARRSNKG